MERKALALADSGIMPVSKNEEPGVIAWQSSNSSSLLPYKKRYSVLYPHAPIHRSRNVDSGTMSVSGNEKPGIVAQKSSNSLLPYKKRYSLLYPHAPIHPSRYVGDLVKPALAENLVGQEAIGTANLSSFGASVQEFNFPISSIHPSLRHKSANVLRISLGSTLRGFNSSVLQLKSEPVEEANAGTAVRPDGTIEDNLQSIELSTKELLEHHSGERRKYGERQGGPRQMRNVKEKEGGNLRRRHEEEFDGFRLKKRRF